jgi:alpha-tubulin suppressor-like RCC1 family protein
VTALDFRATPAVVANTGNAVQLAVGGRHLCARTDAGTIRCWGRNAEGQLGRGQMSPSELMPADVSCVMQAADIVAGGSHTCARLADANNTVVCWGYNSAGQIGDGTIVNRSVPTVVPLDNTVVQLALGANHSCARTMDGHVQCWGDNTYGQLGQDPTPTGIPNPTQVPNLSNVADIAAGGYHTCARLMDGTVRCWGRNNAGQLGDGTQSDRAMPGAVAGVSSVAAITLGVAHTCALRADHTVSCWGWNQRGQIGDPTVSFSAMPEAVSGLSSVASVAAGWEHTCVAMMDGSLRCWGSNEHGQLGDGTQMDHAVPQPVMF